MQLLTTTEAGELLDGISARRVRALIEDGRLPARKYGRDWLIQPAHLDAVKERKIGCPIGTRRAHTSSSIPTPIMKQLIRARDGIQCQRCGRSDDGVGYVVGHILYGGIAKPFNLAMICRPCNALVGKQTWLPRNFEEITSEHPEWRAMILDLVRMELI